MRRTCDECDRTYDDTYRWTFCLHDRFQMRTQIIREGKPDVIATAVEELLGLDDA